MDKQKKKKKKKTQTPVVGLNAAEGVIAFVNSTMCKSAYDNVCFMFNPCDETYYYPSSRGVSVYFAGNQVTSIMCKIWPGVFHLTWHAQMWLNNGAISIGPFDLPCLLSSFELYGSEGQKCSTSIMYASHY